MRHCYICTWLLQSSSQVNMSSADVNENRKTQFLLKPYNTCKTEFGTHLFFFYSLFFYLFFLPRQEHWNGLPFPSPWHSLST